MIFLDTNTLIRFITNDDEILSKLAYNLVVESKELLFITDVVFVEVDYILKEFYNLDKVEIIKIFDSLINIPKILNSKYIPQSIYYYSKSSNSLSDCIIAAQSIGNKLASFDKQLLKLNKIKS